MRQVKIVMVLCVVLLVLAGCRESASWTKLAVGVVLQNIIAPAVAEAWPLVVEKLQPLGLYDPTIDEFRVGKATIIGFLTSLVPACQAANSAPAQVKAQACATHEAALRPVAPVAPKAAVAP